MLDGLLFAAIGDPLCLRRLPDSFSQIMYGLILPLSFSLISLLLHVFFLGISLWIKSKIVKHAQFRSYVAALLWGITGGIAPWGLFPLLQEFNVYLPPLAFLAMFGWFILVPTWQGSTSAVTPLFVIAKGSVPLSEL
jgi:hypothetical protein